MFLKNDLNHNLPVTVLLDHMLCMYSVGVKSHESWIPRYSIQK